MPLRPEVHEQNRRSWNYATAAHNSHKRDQAGFLRGGGSTLYPEELELLGGLVGLRLLHLQCNSGQDTLSLAGRGAQVTGVDISDEAIAFARQLSADSGRVGTFARADVYDWLAEATPAAFDRVFTSYGALCWLSDLRLWARGVASVLAPGGQLVVMEFHPALYLFDEVDGAIQLAPQRNKDGSEWNWATGVNDYLAMSGESLAPSGYEVGVTDFQNPERCTEFEWRGADVVDAIAGAGLVIETVREWSWSNGCKFFSSMVDSGGGRWTMPRTGPQIPLMYGVRARRS